MNIQTINDTDNTLKAGCEKRLVRRFRFHWIGGKTEESEGKTVARAFSALGYGGGAISALDYYEEISSTNA